MDMPLSIPVSIEADKSKVRLSAINQHSHLSVKGYIKMESDSKAKSLT